MIERFADYGLRGPCKNGAFVSLKSGFVVRGINRQDAVHLMNKPVALLVDDHLKTVTIQLEDDAKDCRIVERQWGAKDRLKKYMLQPHYKCARFILDRLSDGSTPIEFVFDNKTEGSVTFRLEDTDKNIVARQDREIAALKAENNRLLRKA